MAPRTSWLGAAVIVRERLRAAVQLSRSASVLLFACRSFGLRNRFLRNMAAPLLSESHEIQQSHLPPQIAVNNEVAMTARIDSERNNGHSFCPSLSSCVVVDVDSIGRASVSGPAVNDGIVRHLPRLRGCDEPLDNGHDASFVFFLRSLLLWNANDQLTRENEASLDLDVAATGKSKNRMTSVIIALPLFLPSAPERVLDFFRPDISITVRIDGEIGVPGRIVGSRIVARFLPRPLRVVLRDWIIIEHRALRSPVQRAPGFQGGAVLSPCLGGDLRIGPEPIDERLHVGRLEPADSVIAAPILIDGLLKLPAAGRSRALVVRRRHRRRDFSPRRR